MPSKGRGPVQVRARRALHALGGASTSEVMEWTHCRSRHRQNSRAARRALEQMGAVRVGRAETRGRPWLWRLRNSAE
jgi:CelD/BcsL family acetyltransferase involved in cellulose biosynthesis